MLKWLKATVAFESADPETTAALITDVFQGFGLQGVVIESPETEPDLDWAEDALPVPETWAVIAFFPKHLQGKDHLLEFEAQIASLHPADTWKFHIQYSTIDEEDWAESWKAHFHPIKVTDRIVVKPTWQTYEPGPGEIILLLDPGMAFGTGTHPTTALCIGLIEKYMTPGFRVCDVGTGSGILMMTAARLGAKTVVGIDSDPMAVEVAEGNLKLNGIDPATYTLITGSLVTEVTGSYDLVVANILAEVIRDLVPEISPRLSPDGWFIASGIIVKKQDLVIRALRDHGFDVCEVAEQEGWVAIVAQKAPANQCR